jgi:hypothetical protein
MRRAITIASFGIALFAGGMMAQAQMATWGWWGTSIATFVPISAANPLPVQCQ